jgi:hypothetical protein
MFVKRLNRLLVLIEKIRPNTGENDLLSHAIRLKCALYEICTSKLPNIIARNFLVKLSLFKYF